MGVVDPFGADVELTPNSLRAIETHAGLNLAGRVMCGVFRPSPRLALVPVIQGAGQDTVELGNTLGIQATFYDENGNVFTPLNGLAQYKITDPSGIVQVDWAAMSSRGIGNYLAQFQLAESMTKGTWLIQARGKLPTSSNYLQNNIRIYATPVA